MAKKYRQYLTDNGVLKPIDDKNENIPLYLETVGAIDSTDRFMGVPYEIKQELTTYENTIEILRQLMTEANIDNINIKMAGWVNGGINSLVPTKIELLKELGGEEGFKKLVDYCNENGFGLFPEFEFSYAVANELFDDFDAKKHLAKTIDNRNAYKKEYDALMQAYAYSNKGIISTNSMLKFYKSLYEDFDDYGIKNISVSSLGTDLSSDFNKDDPLNREDSKTLMSQLLEKMAKDNEQVMISRIDQQIKVNKIMFDFYREHLAEISKEKHCRRYMYNYLEIITVISTILLAISGTEENLQKRKDLWAYFKEKDLNLYRKLRYGFLCGYTNLPGKGGRKISIDGYKLCQRFFKFN